MPPQVPVWDPVVRVLHWALVATVAAAWLTRHGGGVWHEWLGYASAAVLALRVAWGFAGPRRARFASFVRGASGTLDYARAVLSRREPRFVGHNPLGAWMIVALIVAIAAVDLSGWLYTTDRFWGVEWVEEVHDAISSILLAFIAVHVAGVAFTSWRNGENLVAAMVHGRKRAPGAGDMD